jgi:splicing factor 3B subunit 1
VNEDEEEQQQDPTEMEVARKLASCTAPKSLLVDLTRGEVTDEQLEFKKPQRIIDLEDDYRKQRLNRTISPDGNDAFAMGDKTPDASVRTFPVITRE